MENFHFCLERSILIIALYLSYPIIKNQVWYILTIMYMYLVCNSVSVMFMISPVRLHVLINHNYWQHFIVYSCLQISIVLQIITNCKFYQFKGQYLIYIFKFYLCMIICKVSFICTFLLLGLI